MTGAARWARHSSCPARGRLAPHVHVREMRSFRERGSLPVPPRRCERGSACARETSPLTDFGTSTSSLVAFPFSAAENLLMGAIATTTRRGSKCTGAVKMSRGTLSLAYL